MRPDAGQSCRARKQTRLVWNVGLSSCSTAGVSCCVTCCNANPGAALAWTTRRTSWRLERRVQSAAAVADFTGQKRFARPDALELLRALRRAGDPEPLLDIPSADPLNLTGILLPGPRVSPLLTNLTVLRPAI